MKLSFQMIPQLKTINSQEKAATESVFILTEKYLIGIEGSSKHQKLLTMFASDKTMETYRSVTDMLLCRLFPEYRNHCFRYYRHGGKQLKDVAYQEEIELLDKAILLSLMSAKEVVKRQIKVNSRKEFIIACREIIRRAFPYSEEIASKHATSTLFLSCS